MAFDISTAKEVGNGFDLSTAKEVPSENEVIYDSNSQRAISAPQGLDADQFDYLTARQVDGRPSSDFFGFNGGIVSKALPYALFAVTGKKEVVAKAAADVAKGTTRIVEKSLIDISGGLMTEFGEVMLQRRYDPKYKGMFGPLDALSVIPGLAETITSAGQGLVEKNNKFLEDVGLAKDKNDGIFVDIGEGFGSVAMSTAFTFITKNPVYMAALFGAWMKTTIYDEIRAKQKAGTFEGGAAEASTLSTVFAIPEAVIEMFGGKFMLGVAGSKPFMRLFKRTLGEATQESTQQASEESIAMTSGLRPVDIKGAIENTLYAGLIGGIVGAPIHVVTGVIEEKGKENGLREAQIERIKEIYKRSEAEVHQLSAKMLTDEASPMIDDADALKQAKEIIKKFKSGEEIKLPENASENEKIMAAEIEKAVAGKKLSIEEASEIIRSYTKGLGGKGFDASIGTFKKVREVLNQFGDIAAEDTVLYRGHRYGRAVSDSQEIISSSSELDTAVSFSVARNEGIYENQSVLKDFSRKMPIAKIIAPKGSRILDPNKVGGTRSDEMEKIVSGSLTPTGNVEEYTDENGIIYEITEYRLSTKAAQPKPTERTPEEDYAIAAKMRKDGAFKEELKSAGETFGEFGADAFVPVSTRLGKINQNLKHIVRRFVFDVGFYTKEDHAAVKPFVDGVSNKSFGVEDYAILDLALKNRDAATVNRLMEKHGLTKEWATVRETLDAIFKEAKEVGMEIQYLADYAPRKVKSRLASEYMAAMRGREDWSEIETAMREADPNGLFNKEEQAEFVNSFLRGYRNTKIAIIRQSFTKERTVDYVTPEFNKYYEDSIPTLINYISAMRLGIETRKLFGKSEEALDSSIGNYVLNLVKQGAITHEQEQEVRKILKAVADPRGTRGFVSLLKNTTYIYTMGSPISAITQVSDLAYSLYKNGVFNTSRSLIRAIKRETVITKDDIGLENILAEYEDGASSSKAVRRTFSKVGLARLDTIGKDTFTDAAYFRIRDAINKNSKETNDHLDMIFGESAEQVKSDIKNGVMSEDVKYLLFSELSEFQPISLAEMPVHYLQGGNLRVVYMLKTYTLKQISIFRREAFDEIASGEKDRVIKGMKNLIHLSAALMLVGMPVDALKDFILGRDTEITDLMVDNIIKLFGIPKYNIYKAKEDGIFEAALTLVFPPLIAPIDDFFFKDVPKIVTGKKHIHEAEVIKGVPVVGKFFYWWWGGGRAKEEKKKSASLIGD